MHWGGANSLINQIVKLLLFRGGYIGVDIFLVVSGFLICTSILNSQSLPNHQFSLIHFYKRRFYRLSLPLIPLIIFCAVLGYFVLAPNIFHELLSETARALTFVSNQYFAKLGGYFALNSLDKILLHTWYLSLIGQFYIVFPLVVLLINKLLGQKYLKVAIFSLTIFTFVYAEQKFILSKADNLYYLSAMRAWELLFGASLAFIKIEVNNKKLCFYLGIVALVAIIIFKKNQSYIPFSILYVALATALVIVANYQDSRLNNKVVQFVGKSSYSLYLWHWPIMVFSSRLMIFEATWFVVTLILITWLLSYRFEKLDKKYFLVASIIYCLIAACTFGVLASNNKNVIQNNLSGNVKDLYEWLKFPRNGDINEIVVDPNKPINTLMIGDSNLHHYIEYFSRRLNFRYICVAGSLNYGDNVLVTTSRTAFKDYVKLYPNFISALNTMQKGDKVVIANRWAQYADDNIDSQQDRLVKISSPYQKDIMGGIIADLDKIICSYPQLTFYLISQPVQPNINSVTAISDIYNNSKSEFPMLIRRLLKVKLKGFFEPTNMPVVDRLNSYLKKLADKYQNAYFIDRNHPVCIRQKKCFIIEDEKPIYADINHLSVYGGEIVGEYILNQIKE